MILPLLLSAALTLGGPAEPPPPAVSAHAASQTGVESSAYHGTFFRKSQESKRKCIVKRESNGHYFSTNRAHGYFGAYQMNKPLAVGAAWMMRTELRKMFGHTVGTEISRILRTTEPQKWNRFYQDMAWYTIVNWKGTGSGLHHWNGGRFVC